MRTPPPNSENEVWYVVPGRRPRPRNHQTRPQTEVTTTSGGKAREAGRGSSSRAAPLDKGNRRVREGSGEGPAGPLAGEMKPQVLPEG
jgi:hypothetical protein